MPSASSLSLASNPTERWMSLLRRCASGGFRVAAARFGGFLIAMTSRSKKSLRAAEQHRADVARARRRWIRQQGYLDTTRLVFIDESAVTINMVRLRGRCPRGERLISHVPQGAWKTITFVAALRHNKMVAPMRRANQRSSVRGLYRAMLGTDAQAWRHRGDRQPSGPQSCRRQGCHRGRRRDVTVSAAVLAGPQPDRDAVPQIQSIYAKGRRANCRWSLPSDTFVRANRQSRGMSKLLQTCRLCVHMTGICS